jgi:hypothetical protein
VAMRVDITCLDVSVVHSLERLEGAGGTVDSEDESAIRAPTVCPNPGATRVRTDVGGIERRGACLKRLPIILIIRAFSWAIKVAFGKVSFLRTTFGITSGIEVN